MFDFAARTKRGNLWAGMGTGKTVSCLTYLDVVYNVLGDDHPTLVLAPKRVAVDTWPSEQKKWTHLAGLELAVACGVTDMRSAALKSNAPVVVANYDNLVWLREWYDDNKRPWPFKRVIPDESTRLKSFRTRQGGVRAQALGKLAHTEVTHWLNLTGTPSPNGLKDLWGQQWFVDGGERLGRTFTAFQERWFRPIKTEYGANWVPMEHAQEQIQERLADCTLTIDPKDWFNLAEPIVNVIEVEMPASAKASYKELEREMFTQLVGGEVEAVNSAALTIKCLQLANGAVYLDPERYAKGTYIEVHDAKLDALESIISEAAGAPVLVAYHFKSDLGRLQRAFPQGRHLGDDPGVVQEWNAGRVPLLFAHPASAGHGLNLQDGGNILVFFGQWWDLEQHDQIIERIGPMRQMQSGHERAVFIHYIVARGTIDTVVAARRASKRKVQDLLLEYMKEKR